MKRRQAVRVVAAAAFLGAIAGATVAQTGGGYDLQWQTHGAGAAPAFGTNGYASCGTVALVDAGSPMSGGGGYGVRGGFWSGVAPNTDVIFRSNMEGTECPL